MITVVIPPEPTSMHQGIGGINSYSWWNGLHGLESALDFPLFFYGRIIMGPTAAGLLTIEDLAYRYLDKDKPYWDYPKLHNATT